VSRPGGRGAGRHNGVSNTMLLVAHMRTGRRGKLASCEFFFLRRARAGGEPGRLTMA
jgi:hypothetical protein